MLADSSFTLFLGRLHPLLVHLPIGLIVLLAFLELLGRSARFTKVKDTIGPVLLLAVPMAIASAVCGLLLASGGGYDERLLQLHRWTGIGVAALCTLAGLAHWLDLKRVYRLGLVLSFVVLVGASHYGGSLTHGKDYLARHAPGPLRSLLGGEQPAISAAPSALAEKRAFEHVVKPVFDKYCVSCHGPEKAKGSLRLDSLRAVLQGGANGEVILRGKAAVEGSLVRQITLPLDHEDHMPPAGKPQPSADDLALLKWWIAAGTSDKPIRELNPPAAIWQILESRLATSPAAPPQSRTTPRPLAEALPLAEDLAEELGISITALSPNESWLQCNASLAGTNFGDADLARLAPLAANLRWLDLAGTRVTDAGLEQVARMQSLIRLHLERAAITDAGLVFLKDLAELESLNLYGTAVGDVALATLKALPKLRQVYLWQTQVSPEAAKEFAESRRDKAQLAQWETEIRQLREKIASQHVEVELGALAAVPSAESAVPINTICPVSSKLADRTKTLWHEGKLVAFCCDDCKTNFAKDPKPHLAKLTQLANAPPGGLGVKPVNDKCPVSGKAVVPAQTTVYEGKLVAFCCEKCKATFESDPKPHLARLNSALTGTTSDPKP